MSATQHGSLRISSNLGMRALLVVTFVVSGLSFYFWGQATSSSAPRPEYRSAAVVGIGRGPADSLPLEQVTHDALATALLQQTLESVDGPHAVSDSAVQQLGQALQIEPATGNADQQQVRVLCTDSDRARAARLANEAARRWSEVYRALARAHAERRHAKDQQAAEEAQRQYQAAKADLDGYLERHFRDHERLAKQLRAARTADSASARPANEPPPASTAAPQPLPEPQATDSSERAGAERELAELQRTLRQMLLVRTAVHPEVQDLESKINHLKRKLNFLPQRAAAESAATSPPQFSRRPAVVQPPSVATPDKDRETDSAQTHAEASQTFWSLLAALERASEQQQRLAAIERDAWQEQIRGPQIQIAFAPVLASDPAANNRSRPLWAALAAALAFTAGLAMICSGGFQDRPLQTPDEAESATRRPMLGVVRIADLADEPELAQRPSRSQSITWVAAGLLLVLACLAVFV